MTNDPSLPTAAPPGLPKTRTLQVEVFLIAAVVFFTIVGMFHRAWRAEVAQLEQILKTEKDRAMKLAEVDRQRPGYQRLIADLEMRVDLIQTLQSTRVGPMVLMTALGKVMNQSADVNLYSVTSQGQRLALRGQSRSEDSVANFLVRLERSGNFSDVQLRQFYEDNQQDRRTYKFNLDCVYLPAKPADSTAKPEAPAARPARR